MAKKLTRAEQARQGQERLAKTLEKAFGKPGQGKGGQR